MLYTEKYKPKSIDEMFLTRKMEDKLLPLLEERANIIFHGKPGQGKTTFINILINKFRGKTLNIHTSQERGVDIFDKIEQFYKENYTHKGNPLYVVINEVDELSSKAINALKDFEDNHKGKIYFVLSTNNIHKLPEPFLSRFISVNFDLTFDPSDAEEYNNIVGKIGKKLTSIYEELGINVDTEHKKVLCSFIVREYPDIRSLISRFGLIAEGYKKNNTLDYAKFMSGSTQYSLWDEFHKLIKSSDERKFERFIEYYSKNPIEPNKVPDFMLSIYTWVIGTDKLDVADFLCETNDLLHKVQNVHMGQHIFLFAMMSYLFAGINRKRSSM